MSNKEVDWHQVLLDFQPLVKSEVYKELKGYSKEDREDVAADVLVKCLSNLVLLKHDPNPKIHYIYIKKVAFTMSRDFIRSKRIEREKMKEVKDTFDPHTDHRELDETVLYESIRERLTSSLQVDILYAMISEPTSERKLAEKLNIHRKTIRRHVETIRQIAKEESKNEFNF